MKNFLHFITFIFSQLNTSIDVAKRKYVLNSNALVNAISSSQSHKEHLTAQAPKVKFPLNKKLLLEIVVISVKRASVKMSR